MTALMWLLACATPEPAPPLAEVTAAPAQPASEAPSAPEDTPPAHKSTAGDPAPIEVTENLPPIIERPLPDPERRAELAADYWREHYGEPVPEPLQIAPRVVVLHWTAGPSADSAFNTFAPAELGGRPELGGGVNVGAHFLVHQDGRVERLMPDTAFARHVIGLNHLAIGVENVGGPAMPLTEAQIEANVALVRQLAAAHDITHLIGHLEYRAFEGHPYWAELDPSYRTTKPDPGADFMAAVRAELGELGLEGAPKP